jgi:tetratricopeptide (TPR) repeat protein
MRGLISSVVFTLLAGGVTHSRPAIDGEGYRRLVAAYRQQDEAPLRTVLALSVADVQSSVGAALDPAGAWAGGNLRAAALLHTDACVQLLIAGQAERAFAHLNAATRLIDEATVRDPLSRQFAALWYAAVLGLLANADSDAWVKALDERARTVAPVSQAQALFAQGLEFEITACERHDALLFEPFGMRTSRPLRGAMTEFEAALRHDPRLHSAALHLGRAHLLQGSLSEARRHLELATHAVSSSERYLARLFLGAIAEHAGAIGDAESSYRRAISEFQWGQSGPLALAALLSRTNRESESQDIVAALLARAGRTVDPLWSYLARPRREPGIVLDRLRAETWQ